MTKIIYDDIEAVTSLLREKENDLELAAKIGQELLERNQRSDFYIKWTDSLDSDSKGTFSLLYGPSSQLSFSKSLYISKYCLSLIQESYSALWTVNDLTISARMYLQLPLWQWTASNVYLLDLSS